MTLKFLGETSPQKMVLVKNAMADAFAGESKSVFTLESLGVFGSSYAPKVLWTHVKPEETCCVWFQKLKSSLLSQGFAYDRQNFVPHLTLARIRSIDDKKRLRDIVSQYESFTFSEFCVSEIILFESVLLPAGAEYIRHFSVSLD